MVGEPAHIRSLAAGLRREAERVRHVAARVGGTRTVAWRSAAAAAFRDRVTDLVQLLHMRSRQLDGAADDLDRHAAAVEQACAEAQRLAATVEDWARAAASAARGEADR